MMLGPHIQAFRPVTFSIQGSRVSASRLRGPSSSAAMKSRGETAVCFVFGSVLAMMPPPAEASLTDRDFLAQIEQKDQHDRERKKRRRQTGIEPDCALRVLLLDPSARTDVPEAEDDQGREDEAGDVEAEQQRRAQGKGPLAAASE